MGTCKIQYNDSIISEVEETGNVLIKYNDITIKTFDEGTTGVSTVILPCEGKYMAGNLIIGSKTLLCQGKMMSSNIMVTVDNPENRIYIFDSSRSDNFIFGEYRYSNIYGEINSEALTSWPPADSDNVNTSSSQIVLRGTSGSGLSLGSLPFLYLETNSFGTSVNGLLCNNVQITLNGVTYEPRRVGIPTGTYKLKVRGYKTGTKGNGTVKYSSPSAQICSILIDSTSEQVYETDIEIVSKGYFTFSSASGSGDVIIKDVWLEEL